MFLLAQGEPFEPRIDKVARHRGQDGLRYETASRAFADPFALSEHDRIEGGERRWQTLGLVEGHLLLLVAHTVVEDDGDGEGVEIIHIISARKADRKERRRYEEERR